MTVIPQTTLPLETIRSLIEALSGLATVWDGEPLPFLGGDAEGPNAYIELSIVSYVAKGVDDYRQTFDSGTNAYDTQLYGYRIVTVGMLARSFDFALHPADLLERVRWRLRTVSARALFTEVGVALVDVGAASVFNQVVDNRTIYCASADVRFSLAVVDDPQDDDGATIDSVNSGGVIPGTVS